MKSGFRYLFLLLLILTTCSPSDQKTKLVTLEGSTMGTFYTVKLIRSELTAQTVNPDSLHLQLDSLLLEINQCMSTYIEDSEISRFNSHKNSDWFTVSPELASVVAYSHKLSEGSDGAFDITIGPLVNLWGFGPETRSTLIPSTEQIEARKKLVGYKKLKYRPAPPALKKEISEIYCDLSAIAKGYGVDQLAEFLNSMNIENYMVDIGGEIRTSGKNAGDALWKIGVAAPDEEFGIQKVIPLENKAVATSGDYRNYFESEGQRFSHTIDPRTGKPVTHYLASVTVIHDSCMVADGLATAISVMGPEKGLKFARDRELPVLLIVRENKGFVEMMTPQFEEILKFNKIGNES